MSDDRQPIDSKRPKAPCLECRHYFITWDQSFPYGCRAFRFKSAGLPCLEVQSASQMHCLKFEPRKKMN